MKLRKYQQEAINCVLDRFTQGDQRTLIVASTGTGKTVIFAHLAKLFHEHKQGRTLILTHRSELLEQAASKIKAICGIKPDIEKAERRSTETGFDEHKSPIVVASVQTLISGRGNERRMHRFSPNEYGLVIQDEAHHSPAKSFSSVIDYFCQNPKLKLLGVTATPDRHDGEAMGNIFQSVAYEYQLPQAIADGYLVPIRQRRVYIDGLDFSTCRTTAGDINQGDLEEAMTFEAPLHGVAYASIEVICGLAKDSLRSIAEDDGAEEKFKAILADKKPRKTLVFATSVAHAQRLAEIYDRWMKGSADVIHGDMLADDRADVLQRFAQSEIQILVGCMVPTEGFDEPSIEVLVMARPTKSRSLYSQMLGRGTRPLTDIAGIIGDLETPEGRRDLIATSPKSHLEVLDFVGNSGKHDLVCTADILGVDYDEAIVQAAKDAADGTCVDMSQALEKAKEDFEEKKRKAEARKKKEAEVEAARRAADAAKRAGLKGLANYEIADVESPGFRTGEGVLLVGDKRIRMDFGEAGDASNRMTTAQAIWLRDKAKLKPTYIEMVGKLGRKAAGALQAEIQRGWHEHLRTAGQLMCLYKAGYTKAEWGNWDFERASEEIDFLSKNSWRRRPL